MFQLTSNNRDVDRRALDTKISASKDCSDKAGIRGIALLVYLVAAVKLSIPASLDSLLNRVVSANGASVCGAVSSVLATVADILIAFAVVAGGRDLSDGKRGSGNGEGDGQDGEDVLGEHFGLVVEIRDGNWDLY